MFKSNVNWSKIWKYIIWTCIAITVVLALIHAYNYYAK